MEFQKATEDALEKILQIVSDAKERLRLLGIDQWQNGYPNRETFLSDIAMHRLYIATDSGKILAVFALTDREPAYDVIRDGAWLTAGNSYYAVHRIAVAGDTLKKGIGSSVLQFACRLAKEKGFASVRVDTHEGNLPMQKLLEANGFTRCGIIYLSGGPDDGKPRFAYERKAE